MKNHGCKVKKIIAVIIAVLLAIVPTANIYAESSTVTTPVPLIPGNATVNGMKIASVIDGTDFTEEDGLGKDSSGSNNIVRSFDTVMYTLSYTTAMKASSDNPAGYTEGNLYFEAVLPDTTIAEAQFDMSSISSWSTAEEKQNGSDVVLSGYRHLDKGDQPAVIPGAGTLSIPVVIKAAANGKQITPSFKVWLDGDEKTGTKIDQADTFTVTAIPSLNMSLNLADGGETWGAKTSSNNEKLGDGIIQNIAANIQVGSKESAKGVEAPNGPITFVLNLQGQFTDTKGTTVDTPESPKIAYIEDTNGSADISYIDDGNGKAIVTVSNYSIPEISAGSATPINLITMKLGVYQTQPQTIPNNEKYEIIVTDSDLMAKGISGTSIDKATEGTNDNQTIIDDDRVNQSYQNLAGSYYVGSDVGKYLYTDGTYATYNQNNEVISNRVWAHSSNEKTIGENVICSAMIESGWKSRNPFTSNANGVTASDSLIKINPDVMELPDQDEWTVLVMNSKQDTSEATVHVRYAAKPNGTNWNSIEEAKEACTQDLVYYDSREELERSGAICLGVLFEVRDILAYGERADIVGVVCYYTFKVKNDPLLLKNKAIGWTCYDARMYTGSLYNPSVNEHTETASLQKAFVEEGVSSSATSKWNAENRISNDWEPVGYDTEGNKTSGNYNSYVGNSFYITGLSATLNFAIKSEDDNEQTKTVYDVSQGDQQVDLVLNPTMSATNDASIKVQYSIRVLDGCSLIQDKSIMGGTYNSSTGEVDGGTPIEFTSSKYNETKHYTTYYYSVPSIRPSEIQPLHVSVNINSDEVSNGQAFPFRSWFYYGQSDEKLTMFNTSSTACSVLKIGEMRFSKTVVTDGATAATGTIAAAKNGLTYKIGMQDTSAIDIKDMKVLDVLPFNGDHLGTEYTGTYSVKSILLSLGGASVNDKNIKLYYTESKDVQVANYNAANADPTDGSWTAAENSGTDSEPIYQVSQHSTAILVTGDIGSGNTYTLSLPFDVSKSLGSLGNEATVASPDLPNTLHINGTETKIERAVNIINKLTNILTNNTNVIWPERSDYTETLTAKNGYRLPSTIVVKAGNAELTPAEDPSAPKQGEYGYYAETGKIIIGGDSISDDIEVIADAIPVYDLTNKLTNITTDKSVSQKIETGQYYIETLTPAIGYELEETIAVTIGDTPFTIAAGTVSNGISYDKSTGTVTIAGASVAGNVTINAEATPINCLIHFTANEGGTISGGEDQTISYGSSAKEGVVAVPNENEIFVGWEYNYTGLDGKQYSGTTADYTSVSVLAKEVTFKAVFVPATNLTALADHGYVSVSSGTKPKETEALTNSTCALSKDAYGKYPGISAFKAQDNYKLEKITLRDKSGAVAGTLDPTISTQQIININGSGQIFIVSANNDKTAGTVAMTDANGGIIIDYGFEPKSYSVSNNLHGLSTGNTDNEIATYKKDYIEYINPLYIPGTTYTQPETIVVRIGGNELKAANDPDNPKPGEYGYNSKTGKVFIPGDEITGDIEITASASVTVINNLTNLITNNSTESIAVGEPYHELISPEKGYRNPDTIIVTVSGKELKQSIDPLNPMTGEYGYDAKTGELYVPAGNVTGSITVTAKAERIITVTSEIENGQCTSGDKFTIDRENGLSTTFRANDGYELPDSITVLIGDKTITVVSGSNVDGIFYDKATGKVTITSEGLLDDVIINGECVKIPVIIPENPEGHENQESEKNGMSAGNSAVDTGAGKDLMNWICVTFTALIAATALVACKRKFSR
ncbi:MAG: hypothetical protein LKE48_09600 [Solobacterium sp.]|jgi:hypothetical protein|nr:hypothetical protein [Solobacterium sp.]